MVCSKKIKKMSEKNIKILLEFSYPLDADRFRQALNGDEAVRGLITTIQLIKQWESGDRSCPDALIDSVKASLVDALNRCGETNVD